MSGFQQALAYVFAEEGGLADHAADRGGRTNLGVTAAVWERWRDRLGKPGTPVDACTRADAERIYWEQYWLASKCDALPWPVSLAHFDAAVQHGPRNAAILLQRALGVAEDGAIGAQTLTAAERAHPGRLLRALVRGRLAYYRAIVVRDASQRVFLAGWIGRALNLWTRCARDYPDAA